MFRLLRPSVVGLYRVGASSCSCGPTPLSRARVAATNVSQNYNLQNRRASNFTKTIKNTKPKNPIPSDNLIEKLISALSADIHQKSRVYKSDLLRAIANVKENNFSTIYQGTLMLKCCTELLPDVAASERLELADQIWNALKPHTIFTTDHYNELLRVYIANGKTVNAASFISQMLPATPDETTYELILEAICEMGDLNQAAEVISNMKAEGIAASENTFNSLIIGQGRNGNIQNIEEVLSMMKTLKVPPSKYTHAAIARAHLLTRDAQAAVSQLEKARKLGFTFGERHVMELVKCAAILNLGADIPSLLHFLPESTLSNPSMSPYMTAMCTQLVYLNCPAAALEVHRSLALPAFGPGDDRGGHGRTLVRDCVKASMPSSTIAAITQELMTSGRNPIALQLACEAALQYGRVPLALDLLTRMKQCRMPVRPHYFWPILVNNAKSYGEKGVLTTLSTMMAMETKPDYETLHEFVLPFASFSSPQNLMKKLLDCGLVVSDVLTPMMHILLSTGQIRAATELCELFEGKIDSEKLLSPLVKGFITSDDVQSTLWALEEMTKKAMQKDNDWVGRFLCKLLANNKIRHDKTSFVELVQMLKMSSLKISTSALELATSMLTSQSDGRLDTKMAELKSDLDSITDERLVDESEIFIQHIPHPQVMNEVELRSHLAELEAQGMNTRGVLRKLLQKYCSQGDLKQAQEILDKCKKEDVFLSAGMKASVFDLYVKLGKMELAEQALADLTKTFPNFVLDEFKLIDFATLLVYRNKINQAFDLIENMSQRRRIIGGKNIEQNCWRLLDAVASTGTAKQTQLMFSALAKQRLCRPTNIVLGPLVRVHLKNDDLQAAVAEFSRIAGAHRCTPLKHELLCRAARAAGPADPARDPLVQVILRADRKVHGAGEMLSLIAALAELGYKQTLRRLLAEPRAQLDAAGLLQRCRRFADERKLAPIETLAECARGLRHVDVEALYDVMLQVHQRNNDCSGALSLWYKMAEQDIRPQRFAVHLAALLKANNHQVPPDLLSVLDSATRSRLM